MKARNISYWMATGLVAVAFTASGFANIAGAAPVVDTLRALGYPDYLATILGSWKLLGALAIAAPGLPRLKEWAYAGIVFNLTGAVASHLFAGDAFGTVVAPVLFLALAVTSWALRPESRRLGGPLASFGARTASHRSESVSTMA